MKKTLLLGASYEVLNFIDFRKTIKHIVNDKVEVISCWEDIISFGSGDIKYPSIIRLKRPPKRHYFGNNFSRKSLVKRDKSTCFIPNTNILMSDGSLKMIKDIKVGDLVIDAFNETKVVEYIFSKDVDEELLSIKVRGNGNSLECTKEHKLLKTDWILSNISNGGVKASSLSTKDYLYGISPILDAVKISDDLFNYNKDVKFIFLTNKTIKNYCGNLTNRHFKYDNDFGKLIGFFLSEGSCNGRDISFSFHLKEKKYANEVKSLLKNIFGLNARVEIDKIHHTRNVRIGSILLSSLFKDMCYIDFDNNIKSFNYKLYRKTFLEGVLYGILCGDGYFNKKYKKVVLQMKLYNLINDINIICNMLGIYPTISKNGIRPDGRTYKSLNFNSKNYNKIINLCNKKFPKWKSSKSSKDDRNIVGDAIVSKITSIKNIQYKGKVYDLQISGSHTYIANGIAVHNCQYCNKKLPASQVTMDHVLPKAQGGGTSFINCVVACQICNNKKDNRTPEQAGMKLLKRPTLPSFAARKNYVDNPDYWHKDWDDFLNI